MVTVKSRAHLEEIAARVVERMEDLIMVMQDAAERVSLGRAMEELLEAVCCRLKARGLAFACVPDEERDLLSAPGQASVKWEGKGFHDF
jgi:hypothetical protein